MNEQQQEFERNGYIFFPGFLSKSQLVDLQKDIALAQGQITQSSGLNNTGLTFHSNLFRQSAALANFVASDKITRIIEWVCGNKLWVRWDQTITKAPGGHTFPWHRDNAYNKLMVEHYQFWIALTPMNEQNGGLWIVPGSHKKPAIKHLRNENHWEAENVNEKGQCVIANAGDAMLFSSKLLHKTDINHSQEDRTAYVIEYMKTTDFDPGVAVPYLFVENGQALWRKKHPQNTWLKSLRGKMAGTQMSEVRSV